MRWLHTLGQQELNRRWAQARQMLHENGVTYNVYGDPQGMDRPWELDAIPWVIPPDEWRKLETALVQRARLLNAVLADVYGPQRLLQQGLLPPELVFANASFLRPCHGLSLPCDCYLHLYAADLARGPDGQWWVLADRTQNPAGAGYALENRLIVSRLLPELFQQCQVQRLARFFAAIRQLLFTLAPHRRDNPRIVLLTPGPYNETYFEHAYLARYLGYTLVEGSDLTVRDHRVFLKTLAGLQPVDVILRRQDDAFCDPLALHQHSLLGTAGLVQAVRANNVVVVNALGSGWLESTALLPLLPTLCQHLFGEALALPSLPTWWGGQAEGLKYMLQHLAQLVVVPAALGAHREGVVSAQLSRTARQKLADQIRAQPYAYAAQRTVLFSSLPVWQQTDIQPQHAVLRVYVVATPTGYSVMPGGLTRVSAPTAAPVLSMQGDRGSKDTWVLSATPPDAFSLLPPAGRPVTLRRSGYDLPSRVVDNVFWMGRYAERAEGLLRLLRSLVVRLLDDAGLAGRAAFATLLHAMQTTWELPPVSTASTTAAPSARDLRAVQAALFDADLASSVRTSLSALHRAASQVRDYMTLECWRIVTHLHEQCLPPHTQRPVALNDVLALIDQTIMTLSAFSGIGVENMIRGPEWHFLDMGRRLERAAHLTGLLRHTLTAVTPHESAVLEALLEVGDSVITYRSRYLTTLQCAPVLDLLLTDETNPRAIVYQLAALAAHVERLPRDETMPALTAAQRLTLSLVNNVRLAEIDLLCATDPHNQRLHLITLLSAVLTEVFALSETITHAYLSHTEPTRHLAQGYVVNEGGEL
jgi:uncharacterized circularly permuted ATP-grasp superfamily protein/uncharacterized alpha-E superfamily protein